jgi:L-rhamnose mutarotase
MMTENLYVNRYCFGLMNEEIEEDLVLNLDLIKANKIIKDFSVYRSNSFYFFMIHIANEYEKILNEKVLRQGLVNKFINSKLEELKNLDRVFKKDSEKQYLSDENSHIKRIVMTLELKNDPLLLNEYKEIHRSENIWPQIIENMNTMRISDMEIYLYGYIAFLVMEVPLSFDLEKEGVTWGKLPKETEWQEYVSKFQKVDPTSLVSDKWKIMDRIIQL